LILLTNWPIWISLVQLEKKGVKVRIVTEITLDNIIYCTKLLDVCELRHLDGVRTNFGIDDGREAYFREFHRKQVRYLKLF
jgi:hypothetical protein